MARDPIEKRYPELLKMTREERIEFLLRTILREVYKLDQEKQE